LEVLRPLKKEKRKQGVSRRGTYALPRDKKWGGMTSLQAKGLKGILGEGPAQEKDWDDHHEGH